jgi:hypothetical protein
MAKILLGIKTKSTSYSSNSSDGFECGTIEATQVDVVMSGTETQIKTFVNEAREEHKELINLANYMEQLEDMERWSEFDSIRKTYKEIDNKTKVAKYDKLIMVDGVEL